jgi:hypothetical protein
LRDAGLTILDRRVLNHPRAGDCLLEAPAGAWLDYRWWKNHGDAPSFAGTVDIHRKPGYDPLELFLEPATRSITQNASLVRGSHGKVTAGESIVIGHSDASNEPLEMWQVKSVVESMLARDGSGAGSV